MTKYIHSNHILCSFFSQLFLITLSIISAAENRITKSVIGMPDDQSCSISVTADVCNDPVQNTCLPEIYKTTYVTPRWLEEIVWARMFHVVFLTLLPHTANLLQTTWRNCMGTYVSCSLLTLFHIQQICCRRLEEIVWARRFHVVFWPFSTYSKRLGKCLLKNMENL